MYSLCKMSAQKCSDVKGSPEKVKATFVYGRCLGSMKDDDSVEESVIIGQGIELKIVRKFCYLGDMLDAIGGVDSAVTTELDVHGTSLKSSDSKLLKLFPK
jgi:hypothetical protein